MNPFRVGVFAASRWRCAICRTSGVHPAMTLTVVIAEDEEPSREQLRELRAALGAERWREGL